MKNLLVILISLVASRSFADTTALTDILCHKAVGNAIYSFGISAGTPSQNPYEERAVSGKKILIVKEENGQRLLVAQVLAKKVKSGASFKVKYASEFVQAVYTDEMMGSLVISDNSYGVELLAVGNMTCQRNAALSFQE